MKTNPTPKPAPYITYDTHTSTYVACHAYAIRESLKAAGWKYQANTHEWHTQDPKVAKEMRGLMRAATKAVLDKSLKPSRRKSFKEIRLEHEYSDIDPADYPDTAIDGPLDDTIFDQSSPPSSLTQEAQWSEAESEDDDYYGHCVVCGSELEKHDQEIGDQQCSYHRWSAEKNRDR